MVDEKMQAQAKQVFQTLCEAIEGLGLSFEKKEDGEELVAHFTVNGNDIPMPCILIVDAKRQLVNLMSPLPFKMCEEKRMDGAIATCVATYALSEGCFDYNLADGRIAFRIVTSYRGSTISKLLLQYMIVCATETMDRYNDRFMMLDKGMMSIAEFIAKEN